MGRDPVACALTWLLYELSRHPQDMERVVEGVWRVLCFVLPGFCCPPEALSRTEQERERDETFTKSLFCHKHTRIYQKTSGSGVAVTPKFSWGWWWRRKFCNHIETYLSRNFFVSVQGSPPLQTSWGGGGVRKEWTAGPAERMIMGSGFSLFFLRCGLFPCERVFLSVAAVERSSPTHSVKPCLAHGQHVSLLCPSLCLFIFSSFSLFAVVMFLSRVCCLTVSKLFKRCVRWMLSTTKRARVRCRTLSRYLNKITSLSCSPSTPRSLNPPQKATTRAYRACGEVDSGREHEWRLTDGFRAEQALLASGVFEKPHVPLQIEQPASRGCT